MSDVKSDELSYRARADLEGIQKQLQNPDGWIKSGVLKLIQLKDGRGYQLQRMRWWNPFHSRNKEEMKRTAQFIQSLLAAAYPQGSEKTTPASGNSKNSSSLRDEALTKFADYVTRKKSHIETKKLAQLLSSSKWSAPESVPARWKKYNILDLSKDIKSDPYSILFGKHSTPAEVFEKRYEKEIKERLTSVQPAQQKQEQVVIKVRSKWGLDYYAFPKENTEFITEMEALKHLGIVVEFMTNKRNQSTPKPPLRVSAIDSSLPREPSQRLTMVQNWTVREISLTARPTEKL